MTVSWLLKSWDDPPSDSFGGNQGMVFASRTDVAELLEISPSILLVPCRFWNLLQVFDIDLVLFKSVSRVTKACLWKIQL